MARLGHHYKCYFQTLALSTYRVWYFSYRFIFKNCNFDIIDCSIYKKFHIWTSILTLNVVVENYWYRFTVENWAFDFISSTINLIFQNCLYRLRVSFTLYWFTVSDNSTIHSCIQNSDFLILSSNLQKFHMWTSKLALLRKMTIIGS